MSLSEPLQDSLQQAIVQANLPIQFMQQITSCYVPIAQHIHDLCKSQSKPLLLSLQGPQGAGKSTLCQFLTLLLECEFEHQVAVLSLDDFYYDAETRQQLARDIHPLLQTRGVPGTHDLALAIHTLTSMQSGKVIPLPRFDKATDNPLAEELWPDSPPEVSIILFEGWCNNLPAQSEEALAQPINDLELMEDPDGQWRHYVNQQLGLYQERLFSLTDALLCLTIPDFDLVYQWRGLQEDKLRRANETGSGIMDTTQVRRFIQHFERLTRHAMTTLPSTADMLIHLDELHMATGYEITQREGG